jgi:hypothetical protein
LLRKTMIAFFALLGTALAAVVLVGVPLPSQYVEEIKQQLDIDLKTCRVYLSLSLSPIELSCGDVQKKGSEGVTFERLLLRFNLAGLKEKKPTLVGIEGATFDLGNEHEPSAQGPQKIPLEQVDGLMHLLRKTGIHTLMAKNIHLRHGEQIIRLKRTKIRLKFLEHEVSAKITYQEDGQPKNSFKLVYNTETRQARARIQALDVDRLLFQGTGRTDVIVGSPMGGELLLTLLPTLLETQVEGHLYTLHHGKIHAQDLYPQGLEYMHVRGFFSGTLADLNAKIEIGTKHPMATFDCKLSNTPSQWGKTVSLHGHVTHLPHHLLSEYWPEKLGAATRTWVLQNLSQGAVSDATVKLAWENKGGQWALSTLTGGMKVSGMTVHYMEQMPEVHEVSGTATYDQTQFKIHVLGGKLDDLLVKKGDLTFYDLAKEEGRTHIDLTIAGPLKTMLEVADGPALAYPSSLGVSPAQMSGKATTRLDLKMPLRGDITTKDVAILIKAKVKKADFSKEFKAPVGTLNFTQGALNLDITNQRMILTAHAKTRGVPVELSWEEAFNPKSPFKSKMAIKGSLSQEQREALKLPGIAWLQGNLGLSMTSVDNRTSSSPLTVYLDLTASHIRVPSFYEKPAGEASSLTIQVLDTAQISKHPAGFLLKDTKGQMEGHVTLSSDLSVNTVVLPKLLHEGSDAHLTWAKDKSDKEKWTLDVQGKRVNLAPFITQWHEDKTPQEDAAWAGHIHLVAEELVLNPKESLRGVKGDLTHVGKHWTAIDLQGRNINNQVTKILLNEANGQRHFIVDAPSLTPLSPLFSKEGNLKGGVLSLKLDQVGPTREDPWVGKLSIKNAAVKGVPVLAQILSIISPVSMVERLTGQGLIFSNVEADLKVVNNVVTLTQGQATNIALGITFEGNIDQKNRVFDLNGHVIPAYLINSLVGKIPLVGALIAGGKGQGIVSAGYTVTGPFDKPVTSVNPLSVLTPGFTRKLFEKKQGK